MDIELLIDMLAVRGDRRGLDAQLLGYYRRPFALREQQQHLFFAPAQARLLRQLVAAQTEPRFLEKEVKVLRKGRLDDGTPGLLHASFRNSLLDHR